MLGMHWGYWALIFFAALFILRRILRKLAAGRVAKNAIAVISLNGGIGYSEEPGSVYQALERKLKAVAAMKPRALIIRINSPGGTVGASQALHAALLKLRASGIKVVAAMEDVAASGGFYIAMGADRVVAHPGTITGSIGVIIQGYEYSEALAKIGVKVQTICSGDFKDVLNPGRKMRDDEFALLKGVVDDARDQFHATVAEARGLPIEKVREFGDGRVMTGSQAKVLGLVDELGGMPDAVRIAEELAGIKCGKSDLRPLKTGLPVFRKLGLSIRGPSVLDRVLPEAGVSGLPLWRLPKF